MIRYKINTLKVLKEHGVTQYALKRDNRIGGDTLDRLRKEKMIGMHELNRLCLIMNAQPGDIIEYVPDILEE